MTLKECVLNKFKLHSEDDAVDVIAWLEEALGISEDEEVTEGEIESICDSHYEPSEEDMFDWLHEDSYELPSVIRNAPWVDELDNVLVLEDGSCYFWYEINN